MPDHSNGSSDNVFQVDGQAPREPHEPESFINQVRTKNIRLGPFQGPMHEFETSRHYVGPDGNGVYGNHKYKNYVLGPDGGIHDFEEDDPVGLSYTGLFITDPEMAVPCSKCRRLVKVGVDGRLKNGAAICDRCDNLSGTVVWVAIVISGILLLGLLKGLGWF